MSEQNAKEINPLAEGDESAGGSETLRYASDPTPDKAAELPRLEISPPDPADSYEGRCQQTLLLAEEAFAKTGSWVVFFRELLGCDGVVRRLFPEAHEFREFTRGPEFAQLHEMLAAIRSQDQSKSDAAEPERMITIRIPRSLHETLQKESDNCGLSINKLAISKLLWPADPRFIPEQQGRRRGRRPGPQGKRKMIGTATTSTAGTAATNTAGNPADAQEQTGGDPNRRTQQHGGGRPTGHYSRTDPTGSTVQERQPLHSWADPRSPGRQ